jgi:hypothetical protein
MKSVAKHSYVKGRTGKARAKAHVNYIQYRHGSDREQGPRPFFDAHRDHVLGREVKSQIERQEDRNVVMHKMILSPGVNSVDMQAYTREVLREFSREKGLDLDWNAVVHGNTEHTHAHVVIMGRDQNGRQVRFAGRDDYKLLREFGDRYLEREHYLDRYLDREVNDLLRGKDYERSGDSQFKKLFEPSEKERERELDVEKQQREPWDKQKAIDYLSDEEKIVVGKRTYTKFDSAEDLKDLDEQLGENYDERLDRDQYSKMWEWIGTKDRAGDDYYERKEKLKWEDPERARREFEEFDKELKRSLEQERGGIHRSFGREQRILEIGGRLSDAHEKYQGQEEKDRILELGEAQPELAPELAKDLEYLAELEKERKEDRPTDRSDLILEEASKRSDIDRMLGFGQEREVEREQPDKSEEGGGELTHTDSEQQGNEKPAEEQFATGTEELSFDHLEQNLFQLEHIRLEFFDGDLGDDQEKELDRGDEDGFARGDAWYGN